MERGIVISNVIENFEERSETRVPLTNPLLDPIKLRQYLLYWDKIDYPEAVLPDKEETEKKTYETPEMNYLRNANVLKYTKMTVEYPIFGEYPN
ncbi:hypothetical protein QFZ28_006005 [Neobacillus niacini]|uniref:hypothetical protein n=1 Tax=Neobacillus niacini TaxID=86668 RepID=UPI00277E4F3D|nr:hypothetical protein [Neobacillus niacini]MDQ1005427.1 hypothetical protein [Neobacillus niacini]